MGGLRTSHGILPGLSGLAGAGAAANILCTTPLEAGCRRPYEATEPTASAHQRSDPVGSYFARFDVTGCHKCARCRLQSADSRLCSLPG